MVSVIEESDFQHGYKGYGLCGNMVVMEEGEIQW